MRLQHEHRQHQQLVRQLAALTRRDDSPRVPPGWPAAAAPLTRREPLAPVFVAVRSPPPPTNIAPHPSASLQRV